MVRALTHPLKEAGMEAVTTDLRVFSVENVQLIQTVSTSEL